jgi:hypothetical protein
MSSVSQTSIPTPLAPGDQLALACLYNWLLDQNYHQHARETIIAHVIREGTLEGCLEIEPEDMAAAEQVLVNGFDPVPIDDPSWGDFDPDAGCEPIPDPLPDNFGLPEEWNDEPRPANWDAPDSSWEGRTPRTVRELPPGPTGRRFEILPVRGGSPDEEYRPSAEDLREYAEWSAQLDATRAFYDRHSLAEFNASV